MHSVSHLMIEDDYRVFERSWGPHLGLSRTSCFLLEYSSEYLNEYSSTR